MIDRTDDLPIARQCLILRLARSTAYYKPTPTSADDLTLMRRIDELHLEFPFAAARMLRDMLKREGHAVGRKHVGLRAPFAVHLAAKFRRHLVPPDLCGIPPPATGVNAIAPIPGNVNDATPYLARLDRARERFDLIVGAVGLDAG